MRRRCAAGPLRDAPGAHDPGARTGAGGPPVAAIDQHDGRSTRSPDLATDHPDLAVAAATAEQLARLPIRAATLDKGVSIFLLDPRGNLVLRYPADPDIKRLAKDLERLLRASRIG